MFTVLCFMSVKNVLKKKRCQPSIWWTWRPMWHFTWDWQFSWDLLNISVLHFVSDSGRTQNQKNTSWFLPSSCPQNPDFQFKQRKFATSKKLNLWRLKVIIPRLNLQDVWEFNISYCSVIYNCKKQLSLKHLHCFPIWILRLTEILF